MIRVAEMLEDITSRRLRRQKMEWH